MLGSALDKIEELLPSLRQSGRDNLVLQTLLQKSLVLVGLGDEQGAINLLAQVLERAEPEGYTRLFLDRGPLIAGLLRKIPATRPYAGYVQRLLAGFREEVTGIPSFQPSSGLAQPSPSELVEPLSAREQEVLRLVAAGLSNQEIAARLTLAPGTVKRHLHNIFGKLEVNTHIKPLPAPAC